MLYLMLRFDASKLNIPCNKITRLDLVCLVTLVTIYHK